MTGGTKEKKIMGILYLASDPEYFVRLLTNSRAATHYQSVSVCSVISYIFIFISSLRLALDNLILIRLLRIPVSCFLLNTLTNPQVSGERALLEMSSSTSILLLFH